MNKTIFGVFILTIILASAVFYLGSSAVGYAESTLEENVLIDIGRVSNDREATVLEYLEAKRTISATFASDETIINALRTDNTPAPTPLPGEEATALPESFSLQNYITEEKLPLDEDLVNIVILSTSGQIIAATGGSSYAEVTSDFDFISYSSSRTSIQDATVTGDSKIKISVGSPIYARENDATSDVLGIIVTQYDVADIENILSGKRNPNVLEDEAFSSDKSSPVRVYLVNRNGLAITAPQDEPDFVPFTIKQDQKKPVRNCLDKNEEVNGKWINYKDDIVLGASECLDLGEDEFSWIMLAEQDANVFAGRLAPLKDTALAFNTLLGVMAIGSIVGSVRLGFSMRGRKKERLIPPQQEQTQTTEV